MVWLRLRLETDSSCLYCNPSFICTVCTVYEAFLCALCFASEGPLGPVKHCFILITSHDKKDYGCVQMFQLAVTAAVETPCRLYILAITGPRTALLWHSETFPVTGLVSCDLYRCTLHCRGLSLTLKFFGIYDETSKLSGTD